MYGRPQGAARASRALPYLAPRDPQRKMQTMPDPHATSDWLQGDWHLVDLATDEQHIPQHRMDLRFAVRRKTLDGAFLNRNTGDEIPLAAAAFNGAELRYQMTPAPGRTQAEMPWMVMTRIGDRFEGRWETSPGVPIGPTLKLVRARG